MSGHSWNADARCVLLSGGIGGAKLALGLAGVMQPANLTIVVNTGDDFEHLGLSISPDLDTLMYTLAGIVNPDTGWGRRDESWEFMQALGELGGDTWFRLGDRDLATHFERSRRLRAGQSLTMITRELCALHRVIPRLLPMSDGKVRTRLLTDQGELAFQDYFVRRRAEPVVREIRYDGAAQAAAPAEILAALRDPQLGAVIIAPSNPWLSIGPIVAVPALRVALRQAAAPVVAVSPIVGGRAIKGPTAKLMVELGLPVSAAAVARHYGELLDGFIVDQQDVSLTAEIRRAGPAVAATQTVMASMQDKASLARFTLDFATLLAADP